MLAADYTHSGLWMGYLHTSIKHSYHPEGPGDTFSSKEFEGSARTRPESDVHNVKVEGWGTEETAQGLRVLALLLKDPRLIPSAHVGWLKNICNPGLASVGTCTHTNTQ